MEKYNGWTNYATWRVNLEIFDGWDTDGQEYTPDALQDIVEDLLAEDVKDTANLAYSYANAFITNVNWHEIAEHINENE